MREPGVSIRESRLTSVEYKKKIIYYPKYARDLDENTFSAMRNLCIFPI